MILHCICTFRAVTNAPEPGISPGYYERHPHFFHTWVKNKRKMEPKELLSWAIPLLLITYTQQLEILYYNTDTIIQYRYYNKPLKYYSFIGIHSFNKKKNSVYDPTHQLELSCHGSYLPSQHNIDNTLWSILSLYQKSHWMACHYPRSPNSTDNCEQKNPLHINYMYKNQADWLIEKNPTNLITLLATH